MIRRRLCIVSILMLVFLRKFQTKKTTFINRRFSKIRSYVRTGTTTHRTLNGVNFHEWWDMYRRWEMVGHRKGKRFIVLKSEKVIIHYGKLRL